MDLTFQVANGSIDKKVVRKGNEAVLRLLSFSWAISFNISKVLDLGATCTFYISLDPLSAYFMITGICVKT